MFSALFIAAFNLTESTAAVNSRRGIETVFIGARRALPIRNEYSEIFLSTIFRYGHASYAKEDASQKLCISEDLAYDKPEEYCSNC